MRITSLQISCFFDVQKTLAAQPGLTKAIEVAARRATVMIFFLELWRGAGLRADPFRFCGPAEDHPRFRSRLPERTEKELTQRKRRRQGFRLHRVFILKTMDRNKMNQKRI